MNNSTLGDCDNNPIEVAFDKTNILSAMFKIEITPDPDLA